MMRIAPIEINVHIFVNYARLSQVVSNIVQSCTAVCSYSRTPLHEHAVQHIVQRVTISSLVAGHQRKCIQRTHCATNWKADNLLGAKLHCTNMLCNLFVAKQDQSHVKM